jgi:hypothetical protein
MRRTKREWSQSVAFRPWTRKERRVVMRGFFGRFSIAVEPIVIACFFSLLPIGLLLRRQETALLLAPIFGCAALAFLAYAVVLMLPSARAVIETFAPILVVDGYVRYTRSERNGELRYAVAVLDSERNVLGEWPLREWPAAIGEREIWPALVEFSQYGGIHRIDGYATGVLPADIPALGIGVALAAAARSSRLRREENDRPV